MLIRRLSSESSLYTRRGDAGETGLYGSKRVRKDSPRVDAYGNIDELNSCIGLAASTGGHGKLVKELKWIQGRLFVAGADLATEEKRSGKAAEIPRIGSEDTKRLELLIDEMQLRLPRLTSFILPGGGELSAHLHLARSVCRRAERSVVALSRTEKVNPQMVPFLNRLSTYLFNAARDANRLDGKKDEVWQKD
jgi:cob(I)alamin adenosyltransferase